MKYFLLALLLCLSLISQPAFAAMSKIEKQIAQSVDLGVDQSISLLEKIVNINSGTLNIVGVKRVGEILQRQFDDLDFETKWIDGGSFGRAGHLLAGNNLSNEDSGNLKVLLIGHLDTVFAAEDEFQSFERIGENLIAGPGITDMKGGNVVIIAALGALRELNLLNNLDVRVVLTGDEERSGKPLSASKKLLVDSAKWADIALGFEDGDGDIKTAVIARRGSISWELEVTGRAAHSSQIFQEEVGYGAIFETARILDSMRVELAGVGNLTFNPGLISGGTQVEYDSSKSASNAFGKNNVIAKSVKVYGDIRALNHDELADAKKTMEAIITNNLNKTSASITFHEGYPPMSPTEQNKQLLKIYSDVSKDLGFGTVEAVNPRKAGAADISFAADHVKMALDGLGMMGTGGHTVNEVAELDSLSKNSRKAAILLHRLAKMTID